MVNNNDQFGKMGIFEYLSLGDRERIHTEMLHWILSEHSKIEKKDKINLLTCICGRTFEDYEDIEKVKTEDDNMDITFDIVSAVKKRRIPVVIENKFKSKEGKDQLATYDEKLKKRGVFDECIKIFLTPLGEQPKSGDNWKSVSYDRLLEGLCQISIERDVFIKEYKQTLERFICVVRMVQRDPGKYAPVIFNKENNECLTELGSYIKNAKLDKFLQMTWMETLALKMLENKKISTLNKRYYSVDKGSSAGTPLLDVIIGYIVNKDNNEVYRIGIQLQNETLKIFCSPLKYDKERLDIKTPDIELLLTKLLLPNFSGIKLKKEKPTTAGKRGFRSFLYKPSEWSWKYEDLSKEYIRILPLIKKAFSNCPEGYAVKNSYDIKDEKGNLNVLTEWPIS